MAGEDSYVTLHTGAKMPKVGLGTWAQTNAVAGDMPDAHAASVKLLRDTLRVAIQAGYRHIDTAWAYFNEAAIGEALAEIFAEGLVKREEMFITTKLFAFHHQPADVERVLRQQLADLRLSYVDMYLIHSPVPFVQDPERPRVLYPVDKDGKVPLAHVPHIETWRAMEDCVRKGLTKHIGVSNFNHKQVKRLLDSATIPPANLQVECHAYFPQIELKDFCDKHNVVFTAYSPLGSPGAAELYKARGVEIPILIKDPTVAKIAAAHSKNPGQILIRYLYDRGMVVIPKSTNPERIKTNLDVFDFKLSPAEIQELNGLARSRLLGTAFTFAKDHEEYPWNEPF